MTDFEHLIFDSFAFSSIVLPPKRHILRPWLSEQSITLIAGERGTGKTWLALSIVDAITKGIGFGPWKTESAVSCLYLDGELPPQDMQTRLKSLGEGNDRRAPLSIYSNAFTVSYGSEKANLSDLEWQSRMERSLLSKNIKLWVVDNLAALAPGIDENAKKDFDPINQFFLRLRFAGISTLVLHHTGKNGGQRGTSAREDAIDTSIILKKPSNYEARQGARFVMSFTKSRVDTQDLELLSDMMFQLVGDKDGRVSWEYEEAKVDKRRIIIRMLEDGIRNKDIAKKLGVSASYISKVKSETQKEVGLGEKGHLDEIPKDNS